MTASGSISSPARRLGRIRAVGLAATLLVALLLLIAGTGRTGTPIFDAWQRFKPRDLSGTPVYLVYIDAPSLAVIGRWPWPRYYLARLVEQIAARGPKAIGIDAIFSEPDPLSPALFAEVYNDLTPSATAEVSALPPFDLQFGEVIGRHPVVLPRFGTQAGEGRDGAGLAVEAVFAGPLPESVRHFPQVNAAIPELDDVALGHGLINGPPDEDGVVRTVPLVAVAAGQPMTGFALELARVALGVDEVAPVVRGSTMEAVRLGDRRLPVDPDGSMRLHFGDFPRDHFVSAVDLLRQGIPADKFKDGIVLVGLASQGTQDVVVTPGDPQTFGVLVHALAVDTILRGGWLSRPRWAPAAEWGLGIALAGMVLLLAGGRGRLATVLCAFAAVAIATGCWLAFDLGGLLLNPVPPLALEGAAIAGVLLMSFSEARHERERLRESLLTEQLSAAENAGELQAAREIQLGMLPTRELLGELDPRLDVDAMLEPAKSVGGDFYDALRLGRHVIGFSIGDVTGKGVSAALFMAVSRTLSRSAVLREAGDLASAAAMLDRDLARDGNPQMGVTMLLGSIDLTTGAATFCNAGHENPLLIDAAGDVCDLPMEGGPPFCVVDDYPYPAERIRLEPGDALVLFTDGVTEAQDSAGTLFGHERLIAAAAGGGSATEITERILAAVRRFEGDADAADDLTLLVIRYLGDPEAETP